MDELAAQLNERIEALRAEGTGDVRVTRISELGDVQLLRASRAALTSDEQTWLAHQLDQVKENAFGIQVSGLSRLSQDALEYKPDADESDPFDKLAKGIGSVLFFKHPVRWLMEKLFPRNEAPRTGSPLPPPENLVLAAEAWLLAELCEGRLDGDVGVLREPWVTARVDT